MFLTFRNTYKTRKIMLLYASVSIFSFMLAFFAIIFIELFNYWWIYFIVGLFLLIHFFTFFLLVLENNNYKIKYYYSKKKFKQLYNDFLVKYCIDNKKYKKKIKRIAKDYFYQYGTIDERNNDLKLEVFDNWLGKQAKITVEELNEENKLGFFLYLLLAAVWNHDMYKVYLQNLANMYTKNEFEEMIDKCNFIKDEFKDKCLFIYDNPSFISNSMLNNIYLELVLIIQGNIGILSIQDFENMMYNPNCYYSEDKKIAYFILQENDLYNVYEKDLEMDYEARLDRQCDNKENALKVIEENLETYKKMKLTDD